MIKDLFSNATIMFTFITIGNRFIFKEHKVREKSSFQLKLIVGIMTGFVGCILMLYSVRVESSVIVDFRNVAIVLAAISGGFTSAIITSLIIGTFRIVYFGSTISSIVAFIIAVTMGIICPFITKRKMSLIKKWGYATLVCTVIGSIAYAILVRDSLAEILIVYWIGSFLVTAVLYKYVDRLRTSNQLFRRYKEESTRDFLTGLNNVRQFDKIFNNIAEQVVRKEEHLSLLFIDIDFFKKINDTYGHTEGDMVLQELGKILLDTCREFDIVSRNGGEEFSIMLVDCPPEQAINISERIRTTVEKHPFILSDHRKIYITVSIGVATYPNTTNDINLLKEDADSALYKAKRTGRNKVVL